MTLFALRWWKWGVLMLALDMGLLAQIGPAHTEGWSASSVTFFESAPGVLGAGGGGAFSSDLGRRASHALSVSYSSYLGGSGWDAAYAVAHDSAGNIYITGQSSSADFLASVLNGEQTATRHAFVTKLNSSGAILYNVTLASSGNDCGAAIAVDSAGNAYIAGTAGASNFPVTAGAFQTVFGGGGDAFVAKLNSNGQIVYSTFLGGGGADAANGVAVDAAGDAYVAGSTASVSFPTTSNAPQRTFEGGGQDAFVAKLNPAGSALIYSTLLGGSGNDVAYGLAVDASGNAVMVGYTSSPVLPVTNAFQGFYAGSGDGFVASLNASGTAWNFMTYLGGTTADQASAVTVDASGSVYVAGFTNSPAFPVSSGAFQPYGNGNYDAFVVKLTSGGSLVYATYLGGSGVDAGTSLAVDSSGDAWIGGYTTSFNFPVVSPNQSANQGSDDGFIAELNPGGSALLFSTYWGGSLADYISGMTIDSTGRTVAVGYTSSTNYPVTAGALQTTPPAGYNGVVVKTGTVAAGPPSAVSVTPASGSGTHQVFTFQGSDPSGYTNLYFLLVGIAPTTAATNSCYFYYLRSTNVLTMANNQGAWTYSGVLGSSGTVANSQCSANLATSSASGSGNTLSLIVDLTFLPALDGAQNIFLDVANLQSLQSGWQHMGTWTVLASGAPKAVSVTPASGSGTHQVFTFQGSDPSGYTNLYFLLVGIAPTSQATNSCYFYYLRSTNVLTMANNQGAWTYSGVLGSSGMIANSQCSANLATSSASGSGNTLSLTVDLTFLPALAGAQKVFLDVANLQSLQSGWQLMGSWTVP